MIDLKKLLSKAQIVANKKKITTLYWDKNICGFVERQNKEGTLPQYSQEQVNEMLASGIVTVGEDGLPKVVPMPELTDEEKEAQRQAQYEQRVSQLIREKYSADKEFAILRQQLTKIEEYQEYYAYCEECKTKAKTELQ